MKLNIICTAKHKGVKIYVWNIYKMFQYIFTLNNEIYQHYVIVKAKKDPKTKELYNKDELLQIKEILISAAISTIDSLQTQEPQPVPVNK